MKINKRLFTFDLDLMQRLADIRSGYRVDCQECLDLDYILDEKTRQPTICVPCVNKNIKRTKKIIKGLLELDKVLLISSKKLKLSFVTLFLLIEIDPIFFKYHPKIGISINSLFKMNTGELKIV